MLDEIVPALQNFKFQLPLQPINLTGEIEAIKEQMEAYSILHLKLWLRRTNQQKTDVWLFQDVNIHF